MVASNNTTEKAITYGGRSGGKKQGQLKALYWLLKQNPNADICYVTKGREYTRDEFEITIAPDGVASISFSTS